MKAVLALAASLSLASASILPRQIDQIPQCALNCAITSLGSTGCQSSDFPCICRATAFISGLVPCVRGACSAAEYDATLQAAQGLCLAAGVTLSVPAGATETGAPSSSAPSSAAATTEVSTTEAPMTMTTSAPMTMTESTSAETTMAPATTAGGNGTQTTGTRPPTPTGTEPGAASRNTVALGGLGAIVALVAAFL